MNERVDVCSATSTPDDGRALNHWQVREILERVDQHAQWQPGLLQERVRLRDLGQGGAEYVGAAVDVAPLLGLKPGHGRLDRIRGQDVSVLKKVHTLLTPHLLKTRLSN